MNYDEIADKIADVLGSVSGFGGTIYSYIPVAHTETEIAERFVNSQGQIDAWFISRVAVSSLRPGAMGQVPFTYRGRLHTFRISGFKGVVEDNSGTPSEVAFQMLCDDIEAALAPTLCLGVTDQSLVVTDINEAIGYEMWMNTLCHRVTIDLTVREVVQTTYVV